jgi:hypothetical protein
MKKLILIFPLLLLSITMSAQRDPQWLMPLYFRDANGDRDTVYFGYDPEADDTYTYPYYNYVDTLLGENWEVIDTSKFNVYLWSYPSSPAIDNLLLTDTVIKVDIRSMFVGTYIGFCNGKLPITMKWVDSLLYSPSCPFPDLSPRPKARIELICFDYEPGYYTCSLPGNLPLSLTDYPAPEIPFPILDSMVFKGSGLYPPSEIILNITLNLVAHNYTYDAIGDNAYNSLKVYPNPFFDIIHIERPDEGYIEVELLSPSGSVLFSNRYYEEEISIDFQNISKGFYFLKLRTNCGSYTQKIVKTE